MNLRLAMCLVVVMVVLSPVVALGGEPNYDDPNDFSARDMLQDLGIIRSGKELQQERERHQRELSWEAHHEHKRKTCKTIRAYGETWTECKEK